MSQKSRIARWLSPWQINNIVFLKHLVLFFSTPIYRKIIMPSSSRHFLTQITVKKTGFWIQFNYDIIYVPRGLAGALEAIRDFCDTLYNVYIEVLWRPGDGILLLLLYIYNRAAINETFTTFVSSWVMPENAIMKTRTYEVRGQTSSL